MRETTIAKNYAEALLALAKKAKDLEGFGESINGVAMAMQSDVTLRRFLAAPQISAAEKNAVILKAFGPRLPRMVVLFLQKLVDNRRQLLIPHIATEYNALVDEVEGRLHAQVTLAREPGVGEGEEIAAQLSRAFATTVVPHISVNPAILGGIVVRVGDRVMDGSVRRRLTTLRQRVSRA